MNPESDDAPPSRRTKPQLAIVVPCHNEEDLLRNTVGTLLSRLRSLREDSLVAESSYICVVDDGSTDRTWEVALELHRSEPLVRGLKLSRNFGHQNATLAGMLECAADAIVTIDADLQDDESCIEHMVRQFVAGSEIVLGVRADRSRDSLGKRVSARAFYHFMRLLGTRLVFDHADYRLLSRRALDELRNFPETNLFLRGMVPLIGFKLSTVTYTRATRTAGRSKYTPSRMLGFAWEGMTSFSVAPLRLVSALGFMIAIASLAVTAWALLVKFVSGTAIPGWASTVVPMYFLGGVQILCIGVIGEYVGKIYLESKRRPRYTIEERTG